MKILFVCTGNTCRSPMAEAAWRSLPGTLSSLAEVGSAGLMAREGAVAAAHSIEMASRWNIDLIPHRARCIDAAMLAGYDLIVTMTTEGATVARERYPEHAGRIHILGEYARFAPDAEAHSAELREVAELVGLDAAALETVDIDDPFGGSLQEYELTAAQIRRAVQGLAQCICTGRMGRT